MRIDEGLIVFIVILTNVLAYWIKSILKTNGYPVKYFSGHFSDINNIIKLGKSTVDKNTRMKYLILGYTEIVLIITFIFMGILLFSSL